MVPIVFDAEIGSATHRVSGERQKLNKDRNRIALAVRLDRPDHVTSEALISGRVHLRPSRYDRNVRNDRRACGGCTCRRRACCAFTPWRCPSILLRVVEQRADPDAITTE